MPRTYLACSVRDCGLPLDWRGNSLLCPRRHVFDVARSGYINLLQPQDRRSRSAGDSKAAVEARARLIAAGIGRTLLQRLVDQAQALDLPHNAVIVDLGSGAGDALAALADRYSIEGVGVDLSTAAAEHAVRRFPELRWVVANADRRLPLLDHSVDLVISLHARRNPAECARVLRPNGHLLVAVPAADDLIELRELVLGRAVTRSRGSGVLAEHTPFFELIARTITHERQTLQREALLDLLRSTYRGERSSTAARVEALATLDVTLASEIFLFSPLMRS